MALALNNLRRLAVQSAEAAEYTDCISAEGVRSRSNECLWYDIKQSDCETPALEIRECTPLVPLPPVPVWAGVLVPDRVLYLSQIEMFDI